MNIDGKTNLSLDLVIRALVGFGVIYGGYTYVTGQISALEKRLAAQQQMIDYAGLKDIPARLTRLEITIDERLPKKKDADK